ncbi:MAG: enhanced intracellular survival protein Eis [Anaerolineae bacterium]
MSDAIVIRPATPADFDEIARVKAIGFGSDEARNRARLESNPRYNHTHMVVAKIKGETAGVATAFPTQLWLSGVPIHAGAVAGVTTLPKYRRRGVATNMMQILLERMRQEQLALSILYPFSHPYYRRLGYGTAGLVHAYRIAPGDLSVFSEAQSVRPFTPDDLPAVRSLYRGELTWFDGRLTRSNAWWKAIQATAQERREIQAVYDDGGLDGYLRYRFQKNDTGKRDLIVVEMFTASDAAYRGLWGYLAGQMANAIYYLAPPDEPVHQLLANPLAVEAKNNGWIFNEVYNVAPSFMLRIIDIEEALTSRFYPPDMMGEAVFKIDDPQLPANAEPIALRLVDGRPETSPAGDRKPQVETDIVTFSQIYCGFLPPAQARRLNRLTIDDDLLVWLGRAMAAHPLFIHAGDWF